MEKMMKKPEVEAVRFEDADVIATSSKYVAMLSEAKEANAANKLTNNSGVDMDDPSKKWALITWNGDSNSSAAIYGTDQGVLNNPKAGYSYAWYNDNGWQTDGETWQAHSDRDYWPE